MRHSECKRCKDLLFDFASGLTEEKQNKWMKIHLGECPACIQEYEEVMQIVHVMKDMDAPELPSGFQLQLHKKLVEAANHKDKASIFDGLRETFGMGRWKVFAPALACLVLVIGVFGSGLYDDWKNADVVIVREKSSDTPAIASTREDVMPSAPPVEESLAPATPKVESKPEYVTHAQGKETARSTSVPQEKNAETTPQATNEPAVTAEEDAPNSGIAVASEETEASYGLRASGGGGIAALSEQPAEMEEKDQDENLLIENEPVENDALVNDATEAEIQQTPAMSNYRIFVNQSVITYLEICQQVTGIDWSAKADTLEENYALLILTDSEWEIFSDYINSTGIAAQTVHTGDAGVAVMIQR